MACVFSATACGSAGTTTDAGTAALESCSAVGGVTPAGDLHFELKPSGVLPGSALRPVNGEARVLEGGPVISFSDFFTRTTLVQSRTPAQKGVLTKSDTNDELAVLLDPRLVSDFETIYAFARSPSSSAISNYRSAAQIDPLTQLAVRVAVNGTDYLVNGQSAPMELKPWTQGDTLIGGATRFLIADLTVTFDFEGDAACHLRNLTRIVKPEGPLALSDFFATKSAAQLSELQRYLAIAKPHTHVTTLRSNGPAFTNLPSCDLTSLESCLHLTESLTSVVTQWVAACPAPTDTSLKGSPETCLVEGKLTLRPYP